jgi:hypothetical protein
LRLGLGRSVLPSRLYRYYFYIAFLILACPIITRICRWAFLLAGRQRGNGFKLIDYNVIGIGRRGKSLALLLGLGHLAAANQGQKKGDKHQKWKIFSLHNRVLVRNTGKGRWERNRELPNNIQYIII